MTDRPLVYLVCPHADARPQIFVLAAGRLTTCEIDREQLLRLAADAARILHRGST